MQATGQNDLVLTPAEAKDRLAEAQATFTRLVDKAIFDISLYGPKGHDPQTPHARDEAYVIASGSAGFWREGEVRQVGMGDMIFVKAGVDHRFVGFTDDFSTWVFFFGEKPASGN